MATNPSGAAWLLVFTRYWEKQGPPSQRILHAKFQRGVIETFFRSLVASGDEKTLFQPEDKDLFAYTNKASFILRQSE
ncbi:hypothetical protein MGN70_002099 [Eutypa lata]|nr:hypothetical protein MGN70_002099 [Eutypa lata]